MRLTGSVRRLVVVSLLAGGCVPAVHAAQDAPNETPYVATKLIWRWRGIMNATLEDSRAFASEAVVDEMEVFVSPGAVRAVQDKLNEEQLKKADAVVERFALAAVRLSERRDDGSRIVSEEAVQAAATATCPAYPFCAD
ncbi:MAG TPA: hypothetical protein VM032_13970 [Vicinamibacterales bacterium]|nr:hypothetical protein [Vicinamibacterales bacterium]